MADQQSCTDPGCIYNKRGVTHACEQCSAQAIVKCACYRLRLETKPYTVASVKAAVEPEVNRLFEPYRVGRSPTYAPSPDLKVQVALGYWLDEEMCRMGVPDDDRRTQGWKYNRDSRSYDVWETAAECLNDVLEGRVAKNRIGHRRWG